MKKSVTLWTFTWFTYEVPVLYVWVCISWSRICKVILLFDCCEQSLKWLLHPNIHPPIQNCAFFKPKLNFIIWFLRKCSTFPTVRWYLLPFNSLSPNINVNVANFANLTSNHFRISSGDLINIYRQINLIVIKSLFINIFDPNSWNPNQLSWRNHLNQIRI